MSIEINKNKRFIIDRTLPEIVKRADRIDMEDMHKFIVLLKDIGVDFIEINKTTIDKFKYLHEDINLIYRIEDISNIYFMDKYRDNFKYVVIDYDMVMNLKEDILRKFKGKNVTLEIDIKTLDRIFSDENKNKIKNLNIKSIRVKGIVKYALSGWGRLIQKIKDTFNVYVNFCADNKFYMATAVSIEGCCDGVDAVTAAFNGEEYGFASLEEVVMGLKVIKFGTISGNLKSIAQLTEIYKRLTKKEIYCMKPITGEDIFKYESGIHVDGIEKNPNTYEPFNPSDIGAERSMYIGKHSGKRAVMVRLQQLNVDYYGVDMDEFLKKIRENSIRLKRNILDNELIEIYNDFKNTCLM